MSIDLSSAPLGKKSAYIDHYDPSLLFPIPRSGKRNEIGIKDKLLPFNGVDIWTGYELSWLNLRGKPLVYVAVFEIPCESEFLIESKSFKLYLNSFNNTEYGSPNDVIAIMKNDLSKAAGTNVNITLYDEVDFINSGIQTLKGSNIDSLDVKCDVFDVDKELLTPDSNKVVSEVINSNLLKSNCLVTGQPDWGSIEISYSGFKINHENLLRYIVSFRNHNEFHEQCVERIYNDILSVAKPDKLTVYARYTRRGGLDINPIRSTEKIVLSESDKKIRLYRQ